jgi:hypothetical protein
MIVLFGSLKIAETRFQVFLLLSLKQIKKIVRK